jgi:Putative transposase, YhgA-like
MTDHDRLFKELISTFFIEFLALFLPEVRAFVDAGSIEFLDKEIFVDVTSGQRLEPDIVAKVRFKGLPAFFIIHVENQGQAQKEFGRRFFRYFSRLHDKHGLLVYPIAIFSFDSPRKAQGSVYRVEFPNKVVMESRYDVIQLNRLNWKDFAKTPNPVAAALMAQMNIAPKDRARVKLQCLRLLVTLKLDKARMRLISGFIDTYLKLSREEKKEFDAEVNTMAFETRQGVTEIVTSWMEEGLEKGMQKGIQKGLQKGLQEGRLEGRREGIKEGHLEGVRDGIQEILAERFKRVPTKVKRTLKSIDDLKRLNLLLRQAATVSSLKEFERRLAPSAQ